MRLRTWGMGALTILAAGAMALAPTKDEDIEFLKELIRVPSVTDNVPQVNRAVEVMKTHLEKHGLHCVVEKNAEGRSMLYASTRPGKVQDFLLCSHLDVVNAPADMFEPHFEEGGKWLCGRGAADSKGNCTTISRVLIDLAGKASVGAIFSTNEEQGGSTCAEMVKRGYGARKMAIMVDGGSRVILCGQKGSADLLITAHGRGGHPSDPWDIDNPILKLVDGYQKIHAAYPPWTNNWIEVECPVWIKGGEEVGIVPNDAQMALQIHTTRKNGIAESVEMIQNLLGKDFEIKILNQKPPFESDPSHPLMQSLQAHLREEWKEDPRVGLPFIKATATTDAVHYSSLGVPVAVTCNHQRLSHLPGEGVEVNSIGPYAEGLKKFILDNSDR